MLSLSLAPAIHAQDVDVLATYHADNCCLPPEYAWEANVTILEDGRLTLERCTGYATEGSGCKSRRAKVPEAALEAIRTAATESGLSETPAAQNPDPAIGGGGRSGSVVLEGVTIPLPRDPAPADANRVALVLGAISAAIPDRLDRFLAD
jgi:hypothetical protein